MKVAIDGLLLGGRESGVHRCIRGLVKGLAELDGKDEFVVFTSFGFDPGKLPRGQVGLHRTWVASKFRSSRIVYEQFLLSSMAKLKGAQLIHGPGYVVPFHSKLPAVVTVYDIIALKYPQLCKKSNVRHFRMMLPRSVQRARRIIVLANQVKQDLVRHLKVPADRITVIPPGLDSHFHPANGKSKALVKEKYELPEKFILFVGNIEPKKNLEGLIKSFFALKLDRKLEHDLVIVGQKGWQYRPVFDLVHNLDFEAHVHFLDYVPSQDLPALYSTAEAFVFPSHVEGFGIPPLEAMACGTPVLTSNHPVLLESTGSAAMHVPADNRESLRENLEVLLLDQAVRRKLRAAGLKRAASLSWRTFAEQTVEVYREALEN